MSHLFQEYSWLESVNLAEIKTNKVKDMSYLFIVLVYNF